MSGNGGPHRWLEALMQRATNRPMRAAFAAIVLALVYLSAGGAADAALTKTQLGSIGITPPPHAAILLDAKVTREDGTVATLGQILANRPALLIFADYTCQTLCGPAVAFAASALEKTTLQPARDYALIVVGLDPKDSIADARAMKAAQVGDPRVAAATTFVAADAATVARLTAALGYRYSYDKDTDQFAHPAAAFVLKRNGELSRALSALAFSANDLQLALVEAGEGRTGSLADHVRLLCYGFDPAAGVYNVSIGRALTLLGIASVLAIAGAIALMTLWPPRRTPPARVDPAPAAEEI